MIVHGEVSAARFSHIFACEPSVVIKIHVIMVLSAAIIHFSGRKLLIFRRLSNNEMCIKQSSPVLFFICPPGHHHCPMLQTLHIFLHRTLFIISQNDRTIVGIYVCREQVSGGAHLMAKTKMICERN
jgi:hypothetical protein